MRINLLPNDLKNPPTISAKKHEIDDIDRIIANKMNNATEGTSIDINLTFRQLKIIHSVLGLLNWLSQVVSIHGASINLIRSVMNIFPDKKTSQNKPNNDQSPASDQKNVDSGENDENDDFSSDAGGPGGEKDDDTNDKESTTDTQADVSEVNGDEVKDDDKDKGKDKGKEKGGKPNNKNHPGKPDASDYPNAKVNDVYHPSLKIGDYCPLTPCTGKVYPFKRDGEVRSVVVIDYTPPMTPEIYNLHDLRCNLCGEIFKVELPAEIIAKGAKLNGGILNDARAALAVMHYWMGIPLNRLNIFLSMSGKSFAPSSQFDILETVANDLQPICQVAMELAANAPFLQGDDIGGKILSAEKELRERPSGKGISLREKVYTSILIATTKCGHLVPLFKTNIGHLGEFIQEVLEKRSNDLLAPTILSDASKVNTCHNKPVVQGGCWQHAFSNFIDAGNSYQEEGVTIIDLFREIFEIDRSTHQMTQKDRLSVLQSKALPLVNKIKEICIYVQDKQKAIPSSELGRATSYFLNHFSKLILPFQITGIPLTNNISEWTTYPSQRYLDNSRHYKNETGAAIGDVIISLILMCLLNHYNPLEAFKYWLNNKGELRKNPDKFLPWNLEDKIPKMPQNLKFNFFVPLQAPSD